MSTRGAGEARPVQEKRRQELVEAAYLNIAARGFEGLRTRDVAGSAGVNIATLHYYFPTKESLIRGVLDYAMQKFRSTLTPHGAGEVRLRDHLRAVRKLLLDEPELGAVMAELSLRSARDPSMAAIVGETFEAWHTTMRGLLRSAARDGRLRPELATDGTAAIIISVLTSMTLPQVGGSPRTDLALKQLESWLGLDARKRKSSN